MSHHTAKDSYHRLSERLNRFPQGAPPTPLLFQILRVLFTPEEAELVALLPIKPFDAKTAAQVWKKSESEARRILEGLASRGMMLDTEAGGQPAYVLPPPMAGFFEFSMMRIGNQYDQKLLAELYYQYLNVEDDFVRALFAGSETQLGRAFVNEAALEQSLSRSAAPDTATTAVPITDQTIEVLDYERASEVARQAKYIGIGSCYCRHKMQHLDRACAAPMEICMTFGNVAHSLIKHNIARQVDAAECLDLLAQAREHNLVQFGENVRREVSFICNCCGCCCEAMLAAKRFARMNPVATTNYLPEVAGEQCSGCGKCAEVCPVEAMGMVSAGDAHHPRLKRARLNEELCLGCGVCVRACTKNALHLRQRERRVITPVNSAHRAVLMAIERGKLAELIFDNQALASHRAMSAILGAILKLPPLKQAMASRQMKSRYLDHLLGGHKFYHEAT